MKSCHLMLLPSLACPARCGYCFGPQGDDPGMVQETLEIAAQWVHELPVHPREVVFHGGEPLVAGAAFFRQALPRLRRAFSAPRPRLGIQSNLWLLTEELCELFVECDVSIGTSLDGPEAINDAQRGRGYFRRTMAGIERARRYGLDVGCICTFTPRSARRYAEVFDFFVREGLDFSIHAAVPALDAARGDAAQDGWSLSASAYGELLVDLLDLYLERPGRVRVGTLDSLCRSVSAREGGVCTFRDCLGSYLAVAPNGDIYPCQRFVGRAAYRLGAVRHRPTQEQLEDSPAWQRLRQRQERAQVECGDCAYYAFCRGGCPYDALAAADGVSRAGRDPYCPAYRRAFRHITDRALAEVFSDENLEAVVADPSAGTLLRRGPLLALLRGGPHPVDVARRARELIAAVALAASPTPEDAVDRMDRAGLVTDREKAVASLAALRRRLDGRSQGLANLYLHVTYGCNLRCAHCYAGSGPERELARTAMAVDGVERLAREAAAVGFRKVVITGGEPLVHPQRDRLLDALASLREEVKPLQTVLRTNLVGPLSPALLERVAHSTDQVVVSVDGDRASHDARRGPGSYDRTVANLRALVDAHPSAEIVLAAVLTSEQVSTGPGQAVKALAAELGGLPVRFKPLLPLGRARQDGRTLEPDENWTVLRAAEALAYGFRPTATCGIGYSLYVGPGGETCPCYALAGEAYAMGNVWGAGGLRAVVQSDRYRTLCRHTVDSNRRCRRCALRYLCGGACRAWAHGGAVDRGGLDEPPADCQPLFARARALLSGALETLGVSPERWLAAGLPLPQGPPGEPGLHERTVGGGL